jgi:adenylate cyclase
MHRVDPYDFFASAAAAVGQVGLPLDRDGVVRSTWLLHEDRPSLALAAYEVATDDSRYHDGRIRLVDFYGPPRTVRTISLYQALDPAQYLPAGFFGGKLVFVGLALPAASGPAEKDSFPTPFRAASGELTFGVEIHATIAANLVEGRRIRTVPVAVEVLLLLLLPLAATLVFLRLGPLPGGIALAGCAVLPWAVGFVAFSQRGLWLPVIVPSFIQLPTAYLASVLWYYLSTARERERIRRAFSFYLSPDMIGKITKDPGSLHLGGEEIVGTALMTDIQGFTTLAESLPPAETVAMLNAYFSDVTQHIFETEGTLIKFIGDAVFAIWGAPLRQDDHATRACAAALALARAQADAATHGRQLVTRIGVHTGPMVVGNLGSSQRFDYTAIGDAVNVASRLEGLNKSLGTRVVISEATLRACDGRFVTRGLGKVRVVGRGEFIEIHELVGETGGEPLITDAVREGFGAALAMLTARKFPEAARGFRETLAASAGADGPSQFYLRVAERFAAEPPPEDWDGVVAFETK